MVGLANSVCVRSTKFLHLEKKTHREDLVKKNRGFVLHFGRSSSATTFAQILEFGYIGSKNVFPQKAEAKGTQDDTLRFLLENNKCEFWIFKKLPL